MTPKLTRGIYRHYKGQLYQVLELARHSETEEWLVVYKTLYKDFSYWVRPLTMFCETVLINGQAQPRFELIQPLEASHDTGH